MADRQLHGMLPAQRTSSARDVLPLQRPRPSRDRGTTGGSSCNETTWIEDVANLSSDRGRPWFHGQGGNADVIFLCQASPISAKDRPPAIPSSGGFRLDWPPKRRTRPIDKVLGEAKRIMSVSAAQAAGVSSATRAMTPDEKKIILASSLGTVFEWYDFYLYGSLAVIIGAKFFGQFDETTRNIFALLAFAAGFLVRPFGALVFGRLGDLVGRKYTFLVTILIMGASTFIVGILPTSDSIGITAAVILISLRILQGLAIGGEYGGAATYVAEHAPSGRRGFYTSWIQTTATLGLFLSLLVILFVQASMSADDFRSYGWRIPFLASVLLLAVSVWIRLQLSESPAFLRMKAAGTHSRAPLREAFGQWQN